MMVGMKMPDLAATESQIKVVQWLVEVGGTVERGQPLLEVETDKAAMEVECIASGVLREIRAQPDDEVEVGAVIARIEVESTAAPRPAAATAPTDAAAPTSATPPMNAAAPTPGKKGGLFARNRAAKGKDSETST